MQKQVFLQKHHSFCVGSLSKFLYSLTITLFLLTGMAGLGHTQIQFLPPNSTLGNFLNDDENTQNLKKKFSDVLNTNKNLDRFSVGEGNSVKYTLAVQRQLSVILSEQGWVFDAANSSLSENKNESIVLRSIREEVSATVFLFTRDSIGSNVLIFEKNNLETSEVKSYRIEVTWINDVLQDDIQMNKDVYGIVATVQRDDDFIFSPSLEKKITQEQQLAQKQVKESTTVVQNSTEKKIKKRILDIPKKVAKKPKEKSAKKPVEKSVEKSVVKTEELASLSTGIVIDDLSDNNPLQNIASEKSLEKEKPKEKSENKPENKPKEKPEIKKDNTTLISSLTNDGITENGIFQNDNALSAEQDESGVLLQSFSEVENQLEEIKQLFLEGNLENARVLLEQWIAEDITGDTAIAQGLFEIAKALEKRSDSIQNIEEAIALYERIIDEYPLSLFFYDSIQNMLFLQENYISIR